MFEMIRGVDGPELPLGHPVEEESVTFLAQSARGTVGK